MLIFQLSVEAHSTNVGFHRLFGYDQYVTETYTWEVEWGSLTNSQQGCYGRSIDFALICYGLP